MDIKKLIEQIQAAGATSVTINFANDVVDSTPAPALPVTDFAVGDRVLVCHIRRDGTRVHTVGTVDTVCGHDDTGWYTKVTGDNGKHYKTGVLFNQERLGSMIITVDGDIDDVVDDD